RSAHPFAKSASVFLLLTIPPPPRPTLFPYTTLFRSVPALADKFECAVFQPTHGYVADPQCLVRRIVEHVTASGGTLVKGRAARIDRKSTRLNSSHVKISYAVFCLKKKKTHDHRQYSH